MRPLAAGPVLGLRELNRALLARQALLERARLATPRAVESLAGLQAQYPPSPYIALWTRLAGFRREALTAAIERRQVVKATLMRHTLHLVSARDYRAFAAALLEPRLAWIAKIRRERRLPPIDATDLAERAVAALGDRPRPRDEWLRFLGTKGRDDPLWTEVHVRAELVNPAPAGTWGFNRDPLFVPARTWLGGASVDPGAGRIALLRRYLAAFGPASPADIASWTAGLKGPAVQSALEEIGIRRFRDEAGRELIDLRRAPLPGADTPAPVRFLPRFDGMLLAYSPSARERILPERYRRTVISQNGDVLSTFLVDGFVAGAWKIERAKAGATLRLRAFAAIPRRARVELAEEGEDLVRFIEPDAESVRVEMA